MTTYCKECNGEFEHCKLGSERYNEMNVVKKDFYICKRCGRIIEEYRKVGNWDYK